MFTPTGPWQTAIERQRLALRPRVRVAVRSLVAAGMVSLGLCALGSGISTAFASNSPTVTSVKPSEGPGTGGTLVTIRGTNFTGATAVKIGGVAASSFTVASPTKITATVAAKAKSGKVSVTTAAGTTSISGFTFK